MLYNGMGGIRGARLLNFSTWDFLLVQSDFVDYRSGLTIMSQCKSGKLFIITAIIFFVVSGGALTGCGQKGALYLPEEAQKQESEKAKKKKDEPATDTKDETETQNEQ